MQSLQSNFLTTPHTENCLEFFIIFHYEINGFLDKIKENGYIYFLFE